MLPFHAHLYQGQLFLPVHLHVIQEIYQLNKKYLNYKASKKLKKLKFYKYDLNKDLQNINKILKKYKPTYVVNYAAQGMVEQSWNNPEDWYFTNLYSQTKFYNSLLNYKFIKKIIHVSTPEVYGNTKKK